MPLLGELAALTTATCWAFGSLLFTAAGKRLGAFTLNHVRITLAFVLLSLILFLTRGTHWAPDAGMKNVVLLAASGWVGLTLGDLGYFSAFVDVGPRLTTLLMTLAPPLTALLAVPLLGERLGLMGIAGMGITLMGVVWVARERGSGNIPRGHRVRGVVMGTLGSAAQAVGLILSKLGMGNEVDPLPATAIRMGAATLGIWALAAATGRMGDLRRIRGDRTAQLCTFGATILGPVVGVTFSLVAVRLTKTGIAATLMATTPVIVLPLVIAVYKERVSWRAAVGALVAVVGVAVLFLR